MFLGAVSAASLAGLGGTAFAADQCAVFDKARQSTITPEEALARLEDGNARFVAGETVNCDLMAQVRATATGQAPFAAVVGCMDSRVPPELVFDQRIGDIFSAFASPATSSTPTSSAASSSPPRSGRRQTDRRSGPFRMRRDQGGDRQCRTRQPHRHARQYQTGGRTDKRHCR
jgi:hypothetical protein